MEKGRLHYIDIAKGLLMVMVVYGHVDGTATTLGIENSAVDDIHRGANAFVSFYMPCFFLITGYCSNFNKPFSSFLYSSAKSILIPSLFFTFVLMGGAHFNKEIIFKIASKIALYGGSYWFLSSLFIAKIIYWIINKCNFKCILCILSFIIGCLLSSIPYEYEYWWFVHALCLLPFLGMGQLIKYKLKELDFSTYNFYLMFLYTILIIFTIWLSRVGILQKDCFFDVPGITQGFINLNTSMIFSLIILSVSGSLIMLGISIRISHNFILEYIGRNSLVFYCVQGDALMISVKMVSKIGGVDFGYDYKITLCLLIISFLVALIICAAISYIMNFKYLKYLIGKF